MNVIKKTKYFVLLFMAMQTFSYSQPIKKDISMTVPKTTSKTIVFVHGLFVNPASWSKWKIYFESKGYTCYIPANPCHEGNPADLRASINPNLSKIGFEDVVNNIVKLIDWFEYSKLRVHFYNQTNI